MTAILTPQDVQPGLDEINPGGQEAGVVLVDEANMPVPETRKKIRISMINGEIWLLHDVEWEPLPVPVTGGEIYSADMELLNTFSFGKRNDDVVPRGAKPWLPMGRIA